MRRRLSAAGYKEIRTPQVVDRKLWEASGHWDKYRENMFITEIDEEHANEKRVNALKPMNCPCHVQVFNQGIKSYRDLPLRLAEFGSCHRYEAHGALHGLMRVRGFTQDDAHIFCTEDQIAEECAKFIGLLSTIYQDTGFAKFDIKLSTRPEVRIGTDEQWDKAEAALERAILTVRNDYESTRARAPSTGRSSTSSSPMRSGGNGSAAPSRPTSSSPSGSAQLTSARTGRSTAPSCCTARSSAPSSVSSAS
jgi:threonyl-tRNA synthetase